MGHIYYVCRYVAFKINESKLNKEDIRILEYNLSSFSSSYTEEEKEEESEEKEVTFKEPIIKRAEDYMIFIKSEKTIVSGRYDSFVNTKKVLGKTIEEEPEMYIKEISKETYVRNVFNHRKPKDYEFSEADKEMLAKLSFKPEITYVEYAYDDM